MNDNDAPHVVFAGVLARELAMEPTREFVQASDRVLMQLWMEGLKLVPLEAKDLDGC